MTWWRMARVGNESVKRFCCMMIRRMRSMNRRREECSKRQMNDRINPASSYFLVLVMILLFSHPFIFTSHVCLVFEQKFRGSGNQIFSFASSRTFLLFSSSNFLERDFQDVEMWLNLLNSDLKVWSGLSSFLQTSFEAFTDTFLVPNVEKIWFQWTSNWIVADIKATALFWLNSIN